MLTMLPDERREAVQSAFRCALGVRAPDELQPIRGGGSGSLVYRATVKGRSYLLRIETTRDGLRDPERHYQCMQAAAKAGLAPRLIFSDAESAIALTDFIEARPLTSHPGGFAGAITALAGMIRTLQAIEAFPDYLPYFDFLADLEAQLQATGLFPTEATRAHRKALREISAASRAIGERLVASHNDLNPSNVLYDGARLWIIDWQIAFRADQYLDPAIMSSFFTRTEDQARSLLAAWLGREPDQTDCAKFYLMQRASLLQFGLLLLLSAAEGGEPQANLDGPPLHEVLSKIAAGGLRLTLPTGKLALGRALLNQFSWHAESPEFHGWMKFAAKADFASTP